MLLADMGLISTAGINNKQHGRHWGAAVKSQCWGVWCLARGNPTPSGTPGDEDGAALLPWTPMPR